MGLVVQFGARAATVNKPKPDRPCEIAIFPGVRYDRMAGSARRLPSDRPAEAPPRRPEDKAR